MTANDARDGKPRTDAAEAVVTQVRQAIIEGEYPPGSRLIEMQLAEMLDVSRTPVREALFRLAAEGYVELVRNRGAVVTEWSESDLEEIYELRALLESYGLRIAASKIGPDEIAALEQLADEIDRAFANQEPGYVDLCAELNTRFHARLVAAAGNSRLSAIVAQLTHLPLVHRSIRLQNHAALQRSYAQHHDMLAAMRARDGEWAEAVMRAHILGARDAMRLVRMRDRRLAQPQATTDSTSRVVTSTSRTTGSAATSRPSPRA